MLTLCIMGKLRHGVTFSRHSTANVNTCPIHVCPSSGSSGQVGGGGGRGEQPFNLCCRNFWPSLMIYFYKAAGGGGRHGSLGPPGSATSPPGLHSTCWMIYTTQPKECTQMDIATLNGVLCIRRGVHKWVLHLCMPFCVMEYGGHFRMLYWFWFTTRKVSTQPVKPGKIVEFCDF